MRCNPATGLSHPSAKDGWYVPPKSDSQYVCWGLPTAEATAINSVLDVEPVLYRARLNFSFYLVVIRPTPATLGIFW